MTYARFAVFAAALALPAAFAPAFADTDGEAAYVPYAAPASLGAPEMVALPVSLQGEACEVTQPTGDAATDEAACEFGYFFYRGDDIYGASFTYPEMPVNFVKAEWQTGRPSARDYPKAARNRGWEGVTVTSFVVDVDGAVGTCTALMSSGHEALDRAACKVLKRTKWTPAKVDGAAVAEQHVQSFCWRAATDAKTVDRCPKGGVVVVN